MNKHWTEGYNAYYDGRHRIEDNYHAKDTNARIDWNKGYLVAYREDQKLHKDDPEQPSTEHIFKPIPDNHLFQNKPIEYIIELERQVRLEYERSN